MPIPELRPGRYRTYLSLSARSRSINRPIGDIYRGAVGMSRVEKIVVSRDTKVGFFLDPLARSRFVDMPRPAGALEGRLIIVKRKTPAGLDRPDRPF